MGHCHKSHRALRMRMFLGEPRGIWKCKSQISLQLALDVTSDGFLPTLIAFPWVQAHLQRISQLLPSSTGCPVVDPHGLTALHVLAGVTVLGHTSSLAGSIPHECCALNSPPSRTCLSPLVALRCHLLRVLLKCFISAHLPLRG